MFDPDPRRQELAKLRGLVPGAPEAFWADLAAAHAEPRREYHHLGHVVEVADHFASVARGPGWRNAEEVVLAVLFHDAVYVAGAGDNEERSALLCAELTRRHLPGMVESVVPAQELIRLTARHGQVGAEELDEDAAHFLDCDTAILGAEPEVYAAYVQAVAAEYAPVTTPEGWRVGRGAFVSRVLGAGRIFHSEFFHQRLEARARRNLCAELEQLGLRTS